VGDDHTGQQTSAPCVVLIAHEPLASAWRECARHVLGRPADALCVDVPADVDTETMYQQLLARLPDAGGKGVLMLCDVFGATPFNIARRVVRQLNQQGGQAALLTGVNLCMVLKALTTSGVDAPALAELVLERGRKGMLQAATDVITT
jgi:PTS system ascorbate-specific IIA component